MKSIICFDFVSGLFLLCCLANYNCYHLFCIIAMCVGQNYV